jgi:hypothetical protein
MPREQIRSVALHRRAPRTSTAAVAVLGSFLL